MGEPAQQHPVPPRPSSPIYSDAFWRAMATLPSHGVPEALASKALMTWWRIASARPPEPELETPGAALRFTWSFDDVYLHLDVLADGYEWFFRDRMANASVGTERDADPELPSAFFERLAALRERHPA
jgi:hypothetical protein